MTDPALPTRSAADEPPDDRPSIDELLRTFEKPHVILREETIALVEAAPVLIEIAATGLAWAEAEDALQGANHRGIAVMRATEAFDKHRAALRKVRQ